MKKTIMLAAVFALTSFFFTRQNVSAQPSAEKEKQVAVEQNRQAPASNNVDVAFSAISDEADSKAVKNPAEKKDSKKKSKPAEKKKTLLYIGAGVLAAIIIVLFVATGGEGVQSR